MASDLPQLARSGDNLSAAGESADWQDLVLAARSGEPLALDELIETWRSYLFYVLEAEMTDDLRQKVGASDLVQNACLDIHLKFGDFQGNSVEEWRGWLKRMMVHDLHDARRRFVDTQRRDLRRELSLSAGKGPADHVADPHPSPRATIIAQEESEALRAALQRLPEEYRTVLRLRNWECLPLAEVGRQMNRSEEAARKLWSRAVLQLQQEFSK